ncbi:hypothetical protein, partial [Egicoccus sp. AB-alg6-2]|uniref:hypothetical protein n=1 Tax=Egicoccus sp. AB-alg6-2 TaxID=3242692 RepID=UPI00359D4B12
VMPPPCGLTTVASVVWCGGAPPASRATIDRKAGKRVGSALGEHGVRLVGGSVTAETTPTTKE